MRPQDWTPVLDGPIYCSPSCGGKCTLAAYEQANKDAAAMALRLGAPWQPCVTENLGWYWRLTANDIAELWVYPDHCWVSFMTSVGQITASAATPEETIAALRTKVTAMYAELTAVLGELP